MILQRGSFLINNTKLFSSELLERVRQNKIPAFIAAKQAQEMRNVLMNEMRSSTSDFGLALAQFLKKEGLTFAELEGKYAEQLFNIKFENLSELHKNRVWCMIVQKAGEPQKFVSNTAVWMGKAGKGLFALTAIISIYHVVKAQNKVEAAAREAVSLGGGYAGSTALGSAGLLCGPAAIACVPIGVFLGGFIGSSGVDFAFQRFGWL